MRLNSEVTEMEWFPWILLAETHFFPHIFPTTRKITFILFHTIIIQNAKSVVHSCKMAIGHCAGCGKRKLWRPSSFICFVCFLLPSLKLTRIGYPTRHTISLSAMPLLHAIKISFSCWLSSCHVHGCNTFSLSYFALHISCTVFFFHCRWSMVVVPCILYCILTCFIVRFFFLCLEICAVIISTAEKQQQFPLATISRFVFLSCFLCQQFELCAQRVHKLQAKINIIVMRRATKCGLFSSIRSLHDAFLCIPLRSPRFILVNVCECRIFSDVDLVVTISLCTECETFWSILVFFLSHFPRVPFIRLCVVIACC